MKLFFFPTSAKYLYAMLAAIAIIIIVGMTLVFYLGIHVAAVHGPLVDAAMEIRLETTTSHLLLEEILRGGKTKTISDVLNCIDQARWFANAMLHGGRNYERTFFPLKDPDMRRDIGEILQGLTEFEQITHERYEARTIAGVDTEMEQRYHAIFNDVKIKSDRVETNLKKLIDVQITRFWWLKIFLIAIVVILFIIAGITIKAYINRRKKVAAQLRALNQQLDATNQQLKAGEDKLIEQRDFLAKVINSLDNPFYVIDANDFTIKMANKAAAEKYQTDENATCYGLLNQLDKPCAGPDHPCPVEQIKKTKKPVIVEHFRFDENGNESVVEIHAFPVFDQQNNVTQIIEYSLDITERKKAEGALQKSEERYRELYMESPLGYQSLDSEGRFIEVNPVWSKMLGYSKDEVIGRSFRDFLTPEGKELFEQTFPKFKSDGQIKEVEFEIVKKDGSHAVLSFDGKIGYDIKGHFKQTHCVLHDITERKRAEQERERLIRELESVVYVTSHDLRSPLVNIQGFSQELQRSYEQIYSELVDNNKIPDIDSKIFEAMVNDIPQALGFISSSAAKMDSLLTGLLKVSRFGSAPISIETLDMDAILADVIRTMEYKIKGNDIKIQVESLPPCRGDAVQINQVFSNLIDNALKYLDHSRQGSINVYAETGSDRNIYCVEDNGIGIGYAHQAKIFEIFHQLEPDKKKGEGLGLAIVRRILERHNGDIRVESENGNGSKFFVALPTA